ncbi:caspase family protein [Nonomuraea sp. NPDC050556]|uniref:caspase, EACC1-associated type n=1 Tax=Nonomuraea sp. NPDC050556 TaxID=3364369 RepID=UPI0037B8D3A3
MLRFSDFPEVRVLLMGTGEYGSLPDIPAVNDTIKDLAEALERRCGVPRRSIQIELDPPTPMVMGEAIATATESAGQLLLVYFCGHGLVSPSGNLYLSAACTDPRSLRLEHTALPYATLRRYLLDCAAGPLVIILDCCFSGRAVSGLGDADDEVVNLAEVDGAFVMAAAGSSEVAIAPPGERHTSFTGALLRLMEYGDPDGPSGLGLLEVYRSLSRTLRAAGRPVPRCRSSGAAGSLVLTDNRAYRPRADFPAIPPTVGPVASDECPYKGLAAFEATDGAWFFGRERQTTTLIQRLGERYDDPRLLLVSGASGCGKSSLLRAGLLPAVSRGALGLSGSAGWPRFLLTPAGSPLDVLAAELRTEPTADALLDALGGLPHERVVIVVDQFEEVFVDYRDEAERQELIGFLHRAATHRLALVVLGIRADFSGRCADYPELARSLQEQGIVLGPMTTEELRSAIRRPAEAAGLVLEPGLPDLLLDDLGARPGAGYEAGRLPLLSHALLTTWQRRSGRALTLAGYRAAGGIHEALSETADKVLNDLGEPARATARMLLRRLVHVGEGTEDTRRRANLEDLLADLPGPATVRTVLDAFAAARLITVDKESVELTHDALLRAWPTLRSWIDADRAGLLVEQPLRDVAAAWDGRDPSVLYRGTQLALALDWVAVHDAGPAARAFVDASSLRERREQEATQRRNRMLAWLSASLAVLLVVTLAVAGVAVNRNVEATRQRDTALARQVAALADDLRGTDPVRAALMSVAAWQLAPVEEARAALYTSLTRPERIGPAPRIGVEAMFELSADGRTLAVVDAGRAYLWDVADHRETDSVEGIDRNASMLALSPDKHTIAVGTGETVRLWDITARRMRHEIPEGNTFLAFSPHGGLLTVVTRDRDAQVHRIDPKGGRLVFRTSGANHHGVKRITISDNERLAVIAFFDGVIEVWSLNQHRRITRIRTLARAVALSPDSATLAVAGEHDVRFWALPSGRPTPVVLRNAGAYGLWYTHSGTRLISYDETRLSVWKTDGTRLVGHLPIETIANPLVGIAGDDRTLAYTLRDATVVTVDVSAYTNPAIQYAGVVKAAFGPDGRTAAVLAGKGAARTVQLRDIAGGGTFGPALPAPNAEALALDGGGTTVAVGDAGVVKLWDPYTGQARGVLESGDPALEDVVGLAFSRDGRTLAVTHWSGNRVPVQLWDVEQGRRKKDLAEDGSFSMAFSPDGRVLALSGPPTSLVDIDRDIRLPIRAGPSLNGALTVAFSNGGAILAAGYSQEGVLLLDARTGERYGKLVPVRGGSGEVKVLAFSRDDRTLATGNDKGEVRLWDVVRRIPLGEAYTLHTDAVLALAFDAGGGLHSIGADGTHQSYLLDPDRAVRAVCARAGTTLSTDDWRRLIPQAPYRKVC